MKSKLLQILFLSFFIHFGFLGFSQTNAVSVFGYVKDSSNRPIPNAPVTISVDSTSPNSCKVVHVKYTNSNGFYSDTLACNNGSLFSVRVSTPNCNGLMLTKFATVPSSRNIEINFKICSTIAPNPTPVICHANFGIQTVRLKAYFNSNSSFVSVGDTITSRHWTFGDSSSLAGNVKETFHNYASSGFYNTCLAITTKKNCRDTFCAIVNVRDSIPPPPPPVVCKSNFQFIKTGLTVKLNSWSSTASPNDSIISRVWNFGDGTGITTGNIIEPTKQYSIRGNYTVCLTIKTAKNCVQQFCMPVNVVDSPLIFTPVCKAFFAYTPSSTTVRFNSHNSFGSTGDSIISRTWNFGDSNATSNLAGNIIEPTHVYSKPGVYKVCLIIRTKLGCTSDYCLTVIATQVNSNCIPQYTTERILGTKSIRFNSNMSWFAPNDSIVSRRWSFGDATTLTGNVINPLKTYPVNGIYTACLKITTARGCTNEYCRTVVVQDSLINLPPTTTTGVKIVSLFPIPTRNNLAINIWSITGNVRCEVGIYDIYGVRKWSSVITLVKGNNITNVATSFLRSGPYFVRISTTIGNDSKPMYKL